MSYQSRATQSLVLDEFGEGCLGGAGRIPTLGSKAFCEASAHGHGVCCRKTFSAPSAFASLPLIDVAGPLVAPFSGWEGCDSGLDEYGGALLGDLGQSRQRHSHGRHRSASEAAEDADGNNCKNGDVSGGTILAWDVQDAFSDWQGFWNPLLGLRNKELVG